MDSKLAKELAEISKEVRRSADKIPTHRHDVMLEHKLRAAADRIDAILERACEAACEVLRAAGRPLDRDLHDIIRPNKKGRVVTWDSET